MATIVNARDIVLQATSPRVLPVTLPVNVTLPAAQVSGLGTLATQNAVNLSSQVIGYLASGNVTGLGALAMLSSVSLSSAYVVSDLAANRIGAGTIAAGVTFSGTLDASSYVRAYGYMPSAINVDGVNLYPTLYGDSAVSGGVSLLAKAGSSSQAAVYARALGGFAIRAVATLGASDAVNASANSGHGVHALTTSPSHYGVFAENWGGGYGLFVYGYMGISNSSLVTNLNAQYLQGYSPSSFAAASHLHQMSDIADSYTYYKFQFSADGSTWNNIYLRKVYW